jgi:hypothetical protein
MSRPFTIRGGETDGAQFAFPATKKLRHAFDRRVTNPVQSLRATPPQRGANILEGMSDDR